MVKEVSTQLVPKAIKISWAAGALGVATLMNMVAFFALFFMTGVLGINPALAGTLVFVTKIFDVFSDPIVGAWSDRTKTKGSRRRPFLIYGAVISALSFLAIFTTPVFDNGYYSAAYIFVAMIFYTIGYTLFNVPFLSMPSEMTDDYDERSSIHGYRMIFVNVSGLVGAVFLQILASMGQNEWASYAVVGVLGSIIIFVSMMWAYFGTAKARYTHGAQERPNPIAEIGLVFKNKHFMRLIGVKAAQLLGVASIITSTYYFFANIIDRADILPSYTLFNGLIAIISVPLIVRMSKVIDKKKTYIFAALLTMIGYGSWIFAQAGDPAWTIYLRGAITGVAVSGNVIVAMSMLTDIINYDSDKTGVRREGIYTALYTFTEKFTFAFGPLLVGFALAFAGYNKELAASGTQSEDIRQAVLFGFAYIPIITGAVAIALLMGYKLKREDFEGVVLDEPGTLSSADIAE